ncbi:MAG: MotA/TolQ/ExbB proton channel family protein [Prevotella sp.]
MRRFVWLVSLLALFATGVSAVHAQKKDTTVSVSSGVVASTDSASVGSQEDVTQMSLEDVAKAVGEGEDMLTQIGLHNTLKTKFIEGNVWFMSLVALVLVLGLAFCIERIVYLTMAEVNVKKLLADIGKLLAEDKVKEARQLCRDTRGPVASICYQGLLRIQESLDSIERSIASYGSVQAANLDKGCTWISLFITIAPSLGFLGTVVGMVMAFDDIRQAGDINASIVAAGMKVALITTVFGIIAALVLQVFYNFILSKIEHLTSQMEESAISLMDEITQYKQNKQWRKP